MRRTTAMVTAALALCGCGTATAPASTRFMPYLDVTLGGDPHIDTAVRSSGARLVNLGFVVARGRRCSPAWGGEVAVGDATFRREISRVRYGGGDVVPSFGGAGGRDLSLACDSAAALGHAYRTALAAVHARRADFDVEGAALASSRGRARLATAVAALSRSGVIVTLTLPVDPVHGLESASRALLARARAAHARIAIVDLLTQNFGDENAPPNSTTMASWSFKAADRATGQLERLWPRRGGWARAVGVTPIVGVNDVADEIFTLDDARALVAGARERGWGELGIWSIGRDQQCPAPQRTISTTCSGVTQQPFEFSAILRGIDG